MLGTLDKFHKTRVGHLVFGLVELAMAYGFIDWALDTGFWPWWVIAGFLLLGFGQNTIQSTWSFRKGKHHA